MGIPKRSNVVAFKSPHANRNASLGDRSMEKLSSGLRIRRVGDTEASLALSEDLKADILALDQEARTALDQFSLAEPPAGSLIDFADVLARMKDLSQRVEALQQRLETTVRNVNMATENLAAANSSLQDVDVAMQTFSATSILTLQKTGRALLTGGGLSQKVVLSLLRS